MKGSVYYFNGNNVPIKGVILKSISLTQGIAYDVDFGQSIKLCIAEFLYRIPEDLVDLIYDIEETSNQLLEKAKEIKNIIDYNKWNNK